MASCTGQGGQTGTKYSYAQLEGLWINAGGSKTVAPIAAAIAMAESGGCSAALNPTDNNGTQTSWGLWQVSNGTHGQPVPNVLDPGVNAQEAVAKYQGAGNSFAPWGTYSSGAYRQFVSGSTTPDTNVPTATLDSAPGTVNGNSDVGCLFQIGGGKFFGVVNNPLNVCLISTVGARQMIGGALLVGAGIIGLAAAVVLAASAFQRPLPQLSGLPGVGGTARAAQGAAPAPASPAAPAPPPNPKIRTANGQVSQDWADRYGTA